MSMQVTRMCGLLTGLLLAFCGAAHAAETAAAGAAAAPDSGGTASKLVDEHLEELAEVIVYGTSGELIVGLHAESELDAEGIAAYGANTVGELLNQVAPGRGQQRARPRHPHQRQAGQWHPQRERPAAWNPSPAVQVLPPQCRRCASVKAPRGA